jgi:hypothetical protein
MVEAVQWLRDRLSRKAFEPIVFPKTLRAFITALLVVVAPQSSFAQSMTLPGKFSVGTSGSAAYDIPIAVPPGTAGLAPSLSIEYNSQGSNGLLGIGWSLGGLPSIGRCPQTVAQDGVLGGINFNNNDRFCMDGQRLVLVSGAYGADGAQYRTEVETFSEIISHGTAGNGPAWFEVHTKSGQIMELGHTTDSQVLAQGTSTARSWALDKVSDTKGNYFTITYTNDTANGQAYPVEIDYTGNAAANLSPNNKVQFVYATRPDISPQYLAGSFSQTTVRLTDIKTYAGTALVADYKLSYQTSSSTTRSILTAVQLCDGASPANCLPTKSLTWQGQSTLLGTTGFSAGWGGQIITTGDFNGDGTTDILVCPPAAGTCSLYYVNGSTLTPGLTAGWGLSQIFAADFNGDGKADLFICPPSGSAGTCLLYYSAGTSFNQGSFNPGWDGYSFAIADFDGDGRADIFLCPPSSGTCYVYYSTGTSFAQGSFTAGWGGYQIAAADFNGDGRADLYICPTAAGSTCFIYYSTGSSFSGPPIAAWGGNQVYFADFNGDGLADILTCTPVRSGGTGGTCQVYYSTGTGIVASSFTAAWGGYNLSVGDFNNDGKADLMACPPSSGSSCVTYLSTGASFAPYGFNPAWPGYTVIMGDWSATGASGVLAVPPSGAVQQYIASFAPDLLTGINNGLSTTSITYAPLTNTSVYSKDNSASYPQVDVQAPIYVVSQVTTSNGVGGTYSSSYSYVGAKLDLNGRGFLGFRQMTVKDLQTGITDITNYLQSFPYLGLVASTTKSSGSQTLTQSTNTFQFTNVNGTTTISPSSAPYRVSLSQNVSSGSDLDGSTLPSVTTANQYDTLGNATQVAVSTSDGYSKTTNNTYTNDTTNWFLGRLTASTVTAQAPQQLGQQSCTLPWGGTVSSHQSVTAYSATTASNGQICSALAQTRTCTNGTLSGSFTQQACAEVCSLPWGGTINAGQSVTAYSAAHPASGQTCSAIAQTRTCSSTGVLSGSFSQQACTISTTTSVSSSLNPSVFGQTVTFTATVSAMGGGTPSGSVVFLDNGSPVASASLSGGIATLSTSALAAGNHTITATYQGDASFGTSSGSMVGNPQTVVAPPTIANAFFPLSISAGGVATLTITITNPAANIVAESGVAFADTFPSGLVVATPNGLSNTCGGTATATAGSGSISLSGGSISVNSSCTFAVNVTSSAVGSYANTTGRVSSSNGGSGNASNTATLNVTSAGPSLN